MIQNSSRSINVSLKQQINYSYTMNIDNTPNINLIQMKNGCGIANDKTRVNTLPNLQMKAVMKIPQGAKRIGNYILGKAIGSGTFGKVHMGMHVLTGQKVAVKIIEKVKIKGKNIQRTQKSLLLITEFMPNGELFGLIVKQKVIPQNEACRIFHQIIDGVQYLHRMGITHRDLKPQNIMIDYDNQIKIIDYGLSRTYSKNQRLNTACGSPCYASPQMIQGKSPYDPQLVDIWSCGVILYAMICGTLPFIECETSKLYKKIISGIYRPIKGVSQQAKDLIQRILITNPNKRITLSQIKQHPWWKSIKYQPGYGLSKGQRVQYDEDIVVKTAALGFNKERIIQGLGKNEKNKQTGAYYILMKKIVKSGQFVDKYIGSLNMNPIFIQYLSQAFQQQISETAVNSDDCHAQMPKLPSDIQEPTSTCTQNVRPFEWWVFIGTKQYQKTTVNHPKKDIMGQLLQFGFLSNKNELQEEHKKNLAEQQDKVMIIRQLRRKNKQKFYENNNKQHNKGTSDLKSTRITKQSLYLNKPKQRLPGRISTIDRFKHVERINHNSVHKLSINLIQRNSLSNLPKVVISRKCSNSNKMLQSIYLPKDSFFNRKLGRFQKDVTHSLS